MNNGEASWAIIDGSVRMIVRHTLSSSFQGGTDEVYKHPVLDTKHWDRLMTLGHTCLGRLILPFDHVAGTYHPPTPEVVAGPSERPASQDSASASSDESGPSQGNPAGTPGQGDSERSTAGEGTPSPPTQPPTEADGKSPTTGEPKPPQGSSKSPSPEGPAAVPAVEKDWSDEVSKVREETMRLLSSAATVDSSALQLATHYAQGY